jgi:hypothetical protein
MGIERPVAATSDECDKSSDFSQRAQPGGPETKLPLARPGLGAGHAAFQASLPVAVVPVRSGRLGPVVQW